MKTFIDFLKLFLCILIFPVALITGLIFNVCEAFTDILTD